MTSTDERIAAALERIADSLDKLLVTSRTDVDGPAGAADEWRAAPMLGGGDVDSFFTVFHAVREDGGKWVTACAASGCGGAVDTAVMRRLEQVPIGPSGPRRCQVNGCRRIYAKRPPSTQSS